MKLLLSSLGSAALLLATTQAIQSAPYPDRRGSCYFFEKETLVRKQTCEIATGYGAGAMYAILNWPDGVKTRIISNTVKERSTVTVDGQAAQDYIRDARSYRVLREANPKADIIFCQRILSNQNSVCYQFSD